MAIDNDYAIWHAFDNHYWPALYFMDRERHRARPPLRRGTLRAVGTHSPETARRRPRARLRRRASAWRRRRTGNTCGRRDLSRLRPQRQLRAVRRRPRATRHLRAAGRPAHNHWALGGEWRSPTEKAVLEKAGGTLACRFHARDAHLVMSRENRAADSLPRTPRRRSPGPLARRGRRQDGHGVLRTAGSTSWYASTTGSGTGLCRSRSSSPAPRPTR